MPISKGCEQKSQQNFASSIPFPYEFPGTSHLPITSYRIPLVPWELLTGITSARTSLLSWEPRLTGITAAQTRTDLLLLTDSPCLLRINCPGQGPIPRPCRLSSHELVHSATQEVQGLRVFHGI